MLRAGFRAAGGAAGCGWTCRGHLLLDAHVAAEPGTGRRPVLVRIHHLVVDDTALDAVLGRGPRPCCGVRVAGCWCCCRSVTSWRKPGWGCRGRNTSGISGSAGRCVGAARWCSGWLDVHGDGSGAGRGARIVMRWGVGDRLREVARAWGVAVVTVFHVVWGVVLAAVSGCETTWVFGTLLFGRMNAGAGADRGAGPVHQYQPPVRVACRGGGRGGCRWRRR